MGNVPAKESGVRSRSGSFASETSLATLTKRASYFKPGSGSNNGSGGKTKKERQRDKQKAKIDHMMNLVVRFTENVDGGYLAPYGNYKSGLNYRTSIVRELIIERKLAPFYTPLEDFDDSLSDDELLKVLTKLTLHAPIRQDFLEEEEDPDDHKLQQTLHALRRKENKLFKQELKEVAMKAQEEAESQYKKSKSFLARGLKGHDQVPSNDLLLRLYRNCEECPICFLYYPTIFNYSRCCDQPICTECFVQMKRLDPHLPHDDGESPNTNEDDVSDPNDLISEPVKCPFCAMPDFGVTYQPPNFRTGINGRPPNSFRDNVSRIEEENEDEEETEITSDLLSGTELSSDELVDSSTTSAKNIPINTNNNNNKQYRSSIGYAMSKSHSSMGTPPKSSYSDLPSVAISSDASSPNGSPSPTGVPGVRKRRGSLPPTAPGVVTIDQIRPDWEQKLLSAKARIAKRSANATALHATSLLMDPLDEDSSYFSSGSGTGTTSAQSSSYTSNGILGGRRRARSSFLSRISRQEQNDLEQRMIDEALRLSLLDEEERKLKEKTKEEAEKKKNSAGV